MDTPAKAGLLQFLQLVPDPRGREGRRHPHTAMLAALVCAQLQGFPGYDGVARWARAIPIEFWHRLGGLRRPPCANSFSNLMQVLDPAAFERALRQWIVEGLGVVLDEDALGQIVLDGKVLRGTRSRHVRATTVVTALDRATGCVLSEIPVDPSTNEATASLALLKSLVPGTASSSPTRRIATRTRGNRLRVRVLKEQRTSARRSSTAAVTTSSS